MFYRCWMLRILSEFTLKSELPVLSRNRVLPRLWSFPVPKFENPVHFPASLTLITGSSAFRALLKTVVQ